MGDRWDRDRYVYERDRERDRDRFDDRREYYEERDRGYSRNVGGRGPRDRSIERYERTTRAYDDDFVRDRRYYEDDRRFGGPAPRRQSPPPQRDYDRRITIEKDREVIRDDSPGPRRPGLLRRQSSLDTFDRRPPARFYDRVVEYGPPARREDYRPPTGVPIPLPRTKGLPAPPPRRIEREYYDEIKVNDPDFYGDEEFHPYPERIREREVIKTSRHKNRRDHSADSRTSRTSRSTRATSRRGRSRSSSSSSSASSTTRSVTTTTITARSEYPKKGKTRIPTRLVSRRALIELGYPFIEEGNTTVILKALGQQNIDELLKLSEDYKRIELETEAARSPPRVIEERREYERREVDFVEPVMNHPPPPPPMSAPPAPSYAPAPVIVDAAPPPAPTVEVVDRRTVVREVSPARSVSTGTWVLDREINREVSDEMVVGPMVLAERPRSRSRTRRDIRAEIKDLQRELKHGRTGSRDLVRAERLPTGEVVLYEEKVEKIEEGYKGVRIEKDKRGPPPGIVRAMLATLT